MTKKEVVNKIIKQQKILWDKHIERERKIKEWKERQKAKFNRSLVDILHEPKGVEKDV